MQGNRRGHPPRREYLHPLRVQDPHRRRRRRRSRSRAADLVAGGRRLYHRYGDERRGRLRRHEIATYANVRVSNKARVTGELGETLKVAFRGGSVMGLCVGGFALLGIFLVYLIFGVALGQMDDVVNGAVAETWNLFGLEAGFTMTLSSYALGCSIIAMFNRVGGGIYTKAADMGRRPGRQNRSAYPRGRPPQPRHDRG